MYQYVLYPVPYQDPYQDPGLFMLRSQQDAGLISEIMKAINGQYSAIQCYSKLLELAPDEEARKRIREIRQDEIRHLQTFSQIYTRLTGRQPTPALVEECPTEYGAGLEAAFIDEQETVDFYLDIADEARDPSIKEQFRRAAADEQNHAVWFGYLMLKQAQAQ